MSDTLQLALVAVLASVLSAIVTATVNAFNDWRTAAIKRKDREEDWARQDQVAERAEKAAAEVKLVAKQAADAAVLLVDAQTETNRRTDKVAELAKASDERIQGALQVIDDSTQKIHKLVNSDMTARTTEARNEVEANIVSMKALQALQPSEDLVKRIFEKGKRVKELNEILADRLAAQHAVDKDEEVKNVKERKRT